MVPVRLCSRKAGLLALFVLIGLSTTSYSGLAQSETCSLPSEHARMTFPIEKVIPAWACRLSRLSITTPQSIRSALFESVCQHHCIVNCWIARL